MADTQPMLQLELYFTQDGKQEGGVQSKPFCANEKVVNYKLGDIHSLLTRHHKYLIKYSFVFAT